MANNGAHPPCATRQIGRWPVLILGPAIGSCRYVMGDLAVAPAAEGLASSGTWTGMGTELGGVFPRHAAYVARLRWGVRSTFRLRWLVESV
jgi:hypothetical protein